MKKLCISLWLLCIVAANSLAQENRVAGCASSTSIATLDISNVRTIILHNGDMWWDAVTQTNVERYEVPKGSGKTSLFAGTFWIGGIDAGTNLHLAAQVYRQSQWGGTDFWPGPLDTSTADISPSTCSQYDQMWTIKRQDVLDFIGGSPATPAMISYPGNGSGAQAHFLAPFYDNNGDGIYNTADGDYPLFDYIGSQGPNCNNALHGDQAIWFVFNDMGNVHTETQGNPLGIEIQEQAFAFLSTDVDVNNSTFYQYKIINRNSIQYNDVCIGHYIHPSVGNTSDNFVECDVQRGLGYCYNGDNYDEYAFGYGINPPAVGIDFLQGPLADSFDGLDNDRDSIDDETGEQIIMSTFNYFVNSPPIEDMNYPTSPPEYYNYLKGYWRDGTPFHFGSNGYISSAGGCVPVGQTCKFMFPGTSDPYGWNTNGQVTQTSQPGCWNWDEETGGFSPDDYRFLMTAGSFTLLPGAVQYITTSAIWAQTVTGGRLASVERLKAADDKIQAFADNCFDITPLTFSTDAGIASIVNPTSDTLCDKTFSPIVRIENYGSNILTSAIINYQLDANPVQTFTWNGSLPTLGTEDVTLPAMVSDSGTHTLLMHTSFPNSLTDVNAINDSAILSFVINTGILLPLTEGFEATAFPPPNWTRSNGTLFSLPLIRFGTAGGFGNSTASMKAFIYNNSDRDINFTSKWLNISGVTAPAYLTFNVAYAQRSDSSSDTMQVFVSTDCGSTFSLVYSKTDTALATTGIHTSAFVPLASEWRAESVDISPFMGQPHLQVRFYFRSGDSQHAGNHIYVDDINIIGTPTAVNNIHSDDRVNVYPNPVKDNFTIQLSEEPGNMQMEIFNIIGDKIMLSKIHQRTTIISTKDFASGIYFVTVRDGDKVFTRKLVIE